MAQADLEINRKARTVFVRHWIDLGHLSFRSVNGRITVRGRLERIYGQREELTAQMVDTIFRELKRSTGAKGIHSYLENWSNDGGIWRKTGETSSDERSSGTSSAAGDGHEGTYVIDDK